MEETRIVLEVNRSPLPRRNCFGSTAGHCQTSDFDAAQIHDTGLAYFNQFSTNTVVITDMKRATATARRAARGRRRPRAATAAAVGTDAMAHGDGQDAMGHGDGQDTGDGRGNCDGNGDGDSNNSGNTIMEGWLVSLTCPPPIHGLANCWSIKV